MSRDADEVLRLATESVHMRELPFGCSQLWVGVTMAMINARVTTLTFRGRAASVESLARVLACPADDVARCLDPLLEASLLVREPDGGLTCPLLVDQAERRRVAAERREAARTALERAIEVGEVPPGTTLRAMTAQMNGRKGGRPRKDGEPAGQRNMPFYGLVPSASGNPSENPTGFTGKPGEEKPSDVVGSSASRGLTDCLPVQDQAGRQSEGRAGEETQETQHGKTQAAKTQETQREKTQAQVPAAELDRIGRRMLALAGLPAASWGANSRSIVAGWLATGLSETELVVAAEEALRRRPRDVRSLGWFTPLFRQAADDRPAADPDQPQVTLSLEEERRYQAAAREWVDKVKAGDLKARRPTREAFSAEHAA